MVVGYPHFRKHPYVRGVIKFDRNLQRIWLRSMGIRWTSSKGPAESPIDKAHLCLVGGFNRFEKYYPKWESSLNRGENKTI